MPADLAGRVEAADRGLLYLALPLLVGVLAMDQPPRAMGFGVGDWRTGLPWAAGNWAVLAVIAVLRWRKARPTDPQRLSGETLLVAGIRVLTLEFLFRGFLLFLLLPAIGPLAVVIQMALHSLLHVEKDAREVFATIAGALLLGWLAWRTGSFYYGFLIHWPLLAVSTHFAMQPVRPRDERKGHNSHAA